MNISLSGKTLFSVSERGQVEGNMIIRQESEKDQESVYEVVKSAFATLEISNHDEQDLVNRLRKSACFVPELSLVAEEDGEIVGYILFTEMKAGNTILLALAPLAVRPDRQNQKIGSRLVEAGHKIARERGYKGCIVVGHADYYPKLGYQPASKYGITAPFEVPDDNFMAIEFLTGSLNDVSGTIEYAKEFFEH